MFLRRATKKGAKEIKTIQALCFTEGRDDCKNIFY
jgi:hypothetical protein